MECIFCRGRVDGWYQWRWQGYYEGPVCQQCWEQEYPVPGHPPDHPGGVADPEEVSPAFHLIRMERIRNMGQG